MYSGMIPILSCGYVQVYLRRVGERLWCQAGKGTLVIMVERTTTWFRFGKKR